MNKTEKVIEYIKNQIDENNLEVGDKLPCENQLKNDLNVSRYTIRMALDRLCKENIIYTQKGSGSYVNSLNNKQYILIIIHSGCVYGNTRATYKYVSEKFKEEIIKAGYIPYYYIDKENTNIKKNISIKIEEIAGVISIRGRENTLNILNKYNIPIVSTLCSTATNYPSALLDYSSYFKDLTKIIKQNNLKNLIVFSLNYSIKKGKDNFYLYGIMTYFKKYNIKLISITENIPAALGIFRNTMKNLKTFPDGIIFLDDTIFNACYKIFPEFEEKIKNINIITESSGYIDYGNKYNICEIQFNLDNIVKESFNLLNNKINNKDNQCNLYIQPTIINDEIFDK